MYACLEIVVAITIMFSIGFLKSFKIIGFFKPNVHALLMVQFTVNIIVIFVIVLFLKFVTSKGDRY